MAVPRLGVMMLETRFPRPIGDIGNPLTWAMPVIYEVVPRASPERVVRLDARAMKSEFITAALELERAGATLVTTSCGFLSLLQADLESAVEVPVLTSSLLEVARVNRNLPDGRRAGILTISSDALGPTHLRTANVPEDTPLGSPDQRGHFVDAILNDRTDMDLRRAEREVVDAAIALIADNPDLGAIVLECTNMAPYSQSIERATGLPVYSILTAVERWRDA